MQVHKVIWQEGMLLRPQHLQHNDRYYRQPTREAGARLDADFVPTFIYLQRSGYVASCIKEVISLLATRGDAIAARIRELVNLHLAFHASGEFAELELNFWAIRN